MKYSKIELGRVEAVWNKLGGEEGVERFLQGLYEIRAVEHMIDLGANPVTPEGWTVEEHRKGNPAKLERRGPNLYLDGKKIEFYLSKKQKKGTIVGNDLRVELKDQPVLNDNVREYLMKNPHLIPEEWRKDENGNIRYIFFWGTIFRHSDGSLIVRCLCWHGDGWYWGCSYLGNYFYSNYPAAVSAS